MNGSGQSGSSVRRYGRTETWAGASVLVCLAVVAVAVFWRQFSFNPAVLVAQNAGLRTSAGSPPQTSNTGLPPELKAFGPPETFAPDNLYDKIDGKAELYVSAGFVRLNCQRFALKDAPDQWLEWFVYDMGTVPHAFSVFTVQRRSNVQPLDLTEYAYQAQNSLYFVCGSNYVEAVASSASEPLMKAMLALARGFVAANAGSGNRIRQLELLPSENLVPGSYTLQSSDVFGFDQFKNVYTAQYQLGDVQVLGFVMSCPSAEAAAALRDAYRAFLMENGGKRIEIPGGAVPDPPIHLLGSIEIVFSEGPYVAGVHAAPNLEAAGQISTQLHRRLSAKAK